MQLLALGGTFAVIGLVIDSVIGIMAGHVGRRLTEWPKAGPWLNRFAGMVLLGLAVRTALV
ncbi:MULTISPECIES: hypothetical protein [unclassified Streptomyces]|uniref:hypothetical protein n=1 Tax=unclassified Streptomyces TaxID=2593676 RepID=UPI000F71C4FA|nr:MULTISPECIES: hypothetical protein [unclassified Streptomyces]AZM58185.1 hypothetical protein DLM49_00250 [Streptomyces sp. WAC 01438]RSM99013.1 hypothetical protein DMA10_07785 [Streptomyces sp. WAC 01420]